MARLTSFDNKKKMIIVKEEERVLNSNGIIKKDEMYKIMRHLAEKLYEYENKYHDGMQVVYTGTDESDAILCPYCKTEVSRNDDYDEFRPKNCPECGTKLIY